jgi:hypothetical protein
LVGAAVAVIQASMTSILRRGLGAVAFVGTVLLGAACGSPPAPEAPAAGEPAASGEAAKPSSSSSSSSSSGSSANAPAAAPAVPPRMSIHLMNHCGQTVNLKIERSGSTLDTSLPSNNGTDQPIDNGEKVSLADASKNVIQSVTVTPEMREVEIASDCQHLSSH